MNTIYKFPLKPGQINKITMPIGAKILHVGIRHFDTPTIWAAVETDADACTRTFDVRGTGQPMGDMNGYIGTAVGTTNVWHIFEIIDPMQV